MASQRGTPCGPRVFHGYLPTELSESCRVCFEMQTGEFCWVRSETVDEDVLQARVGRDFGCFSAASAQTPGSIESDAMPKETKQ